MNSFTNRLELLPGAAARACACSASVGSIVPLFMAAACGRDLAAPERLLIPSLVPEQAEEVVRIGAQHEGDLELLDRVVQINIGPDANIYALDSGRQEVLVFGVDGIPGRSVGRPGQGPGELSAAERFGFLGDTLWVYDRTRRTFQTFHLDGRFLDERRHDLVIDPAKFERPSQALALLEGGYALFEGSEPAFNLASNAQGPVEHVDLSSGIRDTLIERLVTREGIRVAGGRLNVSLVSDHPLLAWDARGRHVAVVTRQMHRNGEITPMIELALHDARGELARTLDVGPFDPHPISSGIRDSLRENAIRSLERVSNRIRMVGDLVRDPATTIDSILTFPMFYPPVRAARVDHMGRVWLHLVEQPPANRWLLCDPWAPEYRLIDLPDDFQFHDAGNGLVWGVIRDDMNVEYLVGLRFIQNPATR